MTVEELYTKLSALMIKGRGDEPVNINLTVAVETTAAKVRVEFSDVPSHTSPVSQQASVIINRSTISAYTDGYGVYIHA